MATTRHAALFIAAASMKKIPPLLLLISVAVDAFSVPPSSSSLTPTPTPTPRTSTSRPLTPIQSIDDVNCIGGDDSDDSNYNNNTNDNNVVQQKYWPSSLPIPRNCPNDEKAQRAYDAMSGLDPPALEGRCKVDMDSGGGVRFVHVDPPVLVIDGFLMPEECTEILRLTCGEQLPPDAGRVIKIESRSYGDRDDDDHHKDCGDDCSGRINGRNSSSSISSSSNSRNNIRSSTTWYVRYGCSAVMPLLKGLTGLLPEISISQIEEIQLVRYAGSKQGFSWHEDSLEEQFATPAAGGQRIATCLVYLDECDDGRTIFRDLLGEGGSRLAVTPKVGRALLFFPSMTGKTALGDAASIVDKKIQGQTTFGDVIKHDNTQADHRTSHAGEPPTTSGEGEGSRREKHIAQLWVHSSPHQPVVFGRGLNRHSEGPN